MAATTDYEPPLPAAEASVLGHAQKQKQENQSPLSSSSFGTSSGVESHSGSKVGSSLNYRSTSSTATHKLDSTTISDDKPKAGINNNSIKIQAKEVNPELSFAARMEQIFKIVVLISLTLSASISITFTQLVGYPLHYISPPWYQAWMDWTKQLFGILLTFNSQFATPITMHMTGNKTVRGLFHKDPASSDQLLESDIDARAIIISNHQLYTDWVYLWWVAYTANTHGNIFIMLKKSLSKLPLWGWGMKNYRFFFLSRSWAQDEEVLASGLSQINNEVDSPAWLLLFPEGTTTSANGVRKTTAYSQKFDPPLSIPQNMLIPRARGLRFSIEQLHKTVECLYDATIYYEGIPKGGFGEEVYSLKRMYLYGQFPKQAHMYWRRFRLADIPWQDEDKFEKWLQARWTEKDKLLDTIRETGKFGAVEAVEPKHFTSIQDVKTGEVYKVEEGPSEVEPDVCGKAKLNNGVLEVLKIYMVPVTMFLLMRLAYRAVVRG